jgi:hypothetical protein
MGQYSSCQKERGKTLLARSNQAKFPLEIISKQGGIRHKLEIQRTLKGVA